MKIKIIMPIDSDVFNEKTLEDAKQVAAPDTELSIENLDKGKGAKSIEYRYNEHESADGIVNKSIKAAADGFDGIFISCFGNPSVGVVRELLDIPVVGGFDPAVVTATAICQKFSIITVMPSVIPLIEDLVREIGGLNNLASIKDVGIPVLDLENEKKLKEKLVETSLQAIDEDGAQAIVLGCTGMLDVATEVEKRLAEEEGKPAPVVEPTKASITFLQSLIRSGLSQSRLTYYKYPPAEPKGTRLGGLLRTW